MSVLLRDARITRIFEGANDVLRTHAGGMEATQPRERHEIARTFPGDALAEIADELAERVRCHRQAICDQYGVRVLRDHRLLHQLGGAVVLREATDAAILRALAAEDARPRAHYWAALAAQQLDDTLRPLPAAGLVEDVMGSLD